MNLNKIQESLNNNKTVESKEIIKGDIKLDIQICKDDEVVRVISGEIDRDHQGYNSESIDKFLTYQGDKLDFEILSISEPYYIKTFDGKDTKVSLKFEINKDILDDPLDSFWD